MIKLTFCLRRQEHLSRDEFQTYWRDQHGPLVQQHAGALGLLRYVQVHTLSDPLNDAMRSVRGTGDPYDGVAELWWEDKAALEAAFVTPEGRAAGKSLMEDEATFIDQSRSTIWVGEEVTFVGE